MVEMKSDDVPLLENVNIDINDYGSIIHSVNIPSFSCTKNINHKMKPCFGCLMISVSCFIIITGFMNIISGYQNYKNIMYGKYGQIDYRFIVSIIFILMGILILFISLICLRKHCCMDSMVKLSCQLLSIFVITWNTVSDSLVSPKILFYQIVISLFQNKKPQFYLNINR